MKKTIKVLMILLTFFVVFVSFNSINVKALDTTVKLDNLNNLQGEKIFENNIKINYNISSVDNILKPQYDQKFTCLYNNNQFKINITQNNFILKAIKISYNYKSTTIDPKMDLKFYTNEQKEENNDIKEINHSTGSITINFNKNIKYFNIVNITNKQKFAIKDDDSFTNDPKILISRIYFTFVDKTATNLFSTLETKSSLNITYTRNEDNTFNISRVDLRFGARIDKSLYDALIKENITEFGIEITNLEPNISKYYKCNPVVVNEKGMEDENGKFVQFAVVITNIPFENYQTELSGNCCIVDNGTKKYMRNKIASVSTVAKLYIEATDTSSYKEHLDVLTYLSKGGK